MKTILLALLLVNSVHASNLPVRQSYFSVVGIFQRLHQNLARKSVPLKNVKIDYEKSDVVSLLEESGGDEARLPHHGGTFPFLNSEKDVNSFKVDMGLCRGLSSLRRKMRLMAFFDPTLKAPSRDNKKQYKKFYKRLVKDIRNFRPVVFPGYANLYEMSSDPILTGMMQWQVLHEWRNKNFFQGTGTRDLLQGTFKKTSYEKLLDLRARIEKNAKLQHNTMIWLSQKKSSWIHVLEAFGVSEVDESGGFSVYFWNDKFLDLTKAHSTLYVSGDGKLTYDDFIETRVIHAMGITRENDGEMILMSQRRAEFCMDSPSLCL